MPVSEPLRSFLLHFSIVKQGLLKAVVLKCSIHKRQSKAQDVMSISMLPGTTLCTRRTKQWGSLALS
jgi:hypothetical protein